MTKKDPYAALRYKEFNTFIVAFCHGFRLVYAVYRNRMAGVQYNQRSTFSLGLDGSDSRRIDGFVCRTHCRPKGEERAAAKMHFGFSVISFGLFLLTWPAVVQDYATKTILYSIYFLVFLGGLVRAFLGPTIFFLLALLVPESIS
jgi:hypothetical protein